MGQYFILVNLNKKEYIDPFYIGSGAKFLEVCWNNVGKLLVYLLRKSDEVGGGDVEEPEKLQYCGRWAGDRIVLIGDYDKSKLYQKVKKNYKDIGIEAAKEYNRVIAMNESDFKFGKTTIDDEGKILFIPF
ncbi:MAG: hypothetical protein QXJ25_02345 [Candidatus Aenigmatarchaeota archaeon]